MAAPLTIGSGGLTLNPNAAISFGNDPTTLGDYPLINGAIGTPLLSDFVLPIAPASEHSLAIIGGQIELAVSAVPEPSTLAPARRRGGRARGLYRAAKAGQLRAEIVAAFVL